MYAFVLQDWVSIAGVGAKSVIQTEPDWLDMTPFQDLVAWVDVRDATAGVTLFLETSPSRDDNLFVSMNTGGYQTAPAREEALFQTMASTVNINQATPFAPVNVFLANANIPVSHWTRWMLSGPASTWDLTFRIMMAGNSLA